MRRTRRLRKKDSVGGFPSPLESPYDLFAVGHAGTAISTAVGMARGDAHLGKQSHVVAVVGDASVEADAARLVETAEAEFGGVDALVNCAAVRLRAPLTEISAADFAEVLRINLVGAFVLTKAVVPAMRAREGGSIIHIGSALGTVAAPDFSPYVASKGGVHQLARAAAVELVQDEIRVNVVAPGTIDTAIGMGVPEFRRHLLKHRIPIGRAGHVSDVAASILPPTPPATSPARSWPWMAAGRRPDPMREHGHCPAS